MKLSLLSKNKRGTVGGVLERLLFYLRVGGKGVWSASGETAGLSAAERLLSLVSITQSS